MTQPWQRWSANRKRDVVLRVLRGEPVEILARDVQVPVLEIERWERQFLEAGRAGLRVRQAASDGRVLRDVQARLLALTDRLEAVERALGQRADRRPLAKSSTGERSTASGAWRAPDQGAASRPGDEA